MRRLCQHSFEQNRVAEAWSIGKNARKIINAHFAWDYEIWVITLSIIAIDQVCKYNKNEFEVLIYMHR